VAGELDQAVSQYEQALVIDTRHVAALVALGHVLLERGGVDMVNDRLANALELEPTHYKVYRTKCGRRERALGGRPWLTDGVLGVGYRPCWAWPACLPPTGGGSKPVSWCWIA
jgi:hypothetical protein